MRVVPVHATNVHAFWLSPVLRCAPRLTCQLETDSLIGRGIFQVCSQRPQHALVPVVVAVQIVLMIGLGLLLSMANLFYRDVGFLFRSIIQLWMFVTCVVYQLEATAGWKKAVIQLNPMTPIIRAYRDCLIHGRSPFDLAFGNAAAVSVMVLLVGWWWFRRREFEFAENI